jgi:hypothetical protein
MPEAKKLGRRERRRDARDAGRGGVMIAEGLRPTASAQERIGLLLAIGLSVEELALTIGVAENTIRNWADGAGDPRRAADRALDDLRTVVEALTEAGVEGSRAVNWLRSRNRAWLENERPLDVLRIDPLLVLAAAEEPTVLEQEPRQTVHSIRDAQAQRESRSREAARAAERKAAAVK